MEFVIYLGNYKFFNTVPSLFSYSAVSFVYATVFSTFDDAAKSREKHLGKNIEFPTVANIMPKTSYFEGRIMPY